MLVSPRADLNAPRVLFFIGIFASKLLITPIVSTLGSVSDISGEFSNAASPIVKTCGKLIAVNPGSSLNCPSVTTVVIAKNSAFLVGSLNVPT